MRFPKTYLDLSGERFLVHYHIGARDETEAQARARGICLEQTVEVAEGLLADDDLRGQVVGRIEKMVERDRCLFEVVISYAIETTAFELPQLLNVAFGNTAMQKDIRVVDLDLPDSLLAHFPGPRFGQVGLRRLLGVYQRPLLCTALKPMGLGSRQLADMAYQFALGGIDIIKEDHGLTDQAFAPFDERVARCAEAVRKANAHNNTRSLYIANITGPADQIVERAHAAKRWGADGVMVAPGLSGWDVIRQLAADKAWGLPIFSHPAWLGALVNGEGHGLDHGVTFGQLPRLAGADATIFVNFGGRFPFTPEDCGAIIRGATATMGSYPPIFPVPAGGMTLEHLPEMDRFYGRDAIFLIAGGLYAHGPNLTDNARRFRSQVEALAQT
ncbi:MAG: ribulose 1,5-bisphosphate carboxylase large subunit [Chloroflexi bacterium]|nr:MAG: ribulose 1,5-bisphosphate carboxylase large subunit [Chloroflexota bacterium]